MALLLAGCVSTQGAVQADGDPTGQARTYTPWPGPGALNPAVVALLPAGVGAADVRLGSDGCYYYDQGGTIVAVRYDNDPEHYYCIG